MRLKLQQDPLSNSPISDMLLIFMYHFLYYNQSFTKPIHSVIFKQEFLVASMILERVSKLEHFTASFACTQQQREVSSTKIVSTYLRSNLNQLIEEGRRDEFT